MGDAKQIESQETGQDRSEIQSLAQERRMFSSPRARVELMGTLEPNGSALAKIRRAIKDVQNQGQETLTKIDVLITVYDAVGTMSGAIGDFGLAEWWDDIERWELYFLTPSNRYGVLDGDLNSGSSATVSVHRNSTDTGDDVTVYDRDFIPASFKLQTGARISFYMHKSEKVNVLLTSDACPVAQ